MNVKFYIEPYENPFNDELNMVALYVFPDEAPEGFDTEDVRGDFPEIGDVVSKYGMANEMENCFSVEKGDKSWKEWVRIFLNEGWEFQPQEYFWNFDSSYFEEEDKTIHLAFLRQLNEMKEAGEIKINEEFNLDKIIDTLESVD